MTFEDAIAYIDSFYTHQTIPGLHRIRELMEKLGDPQKELKFVHVAGTNGKGSACAMTESILRSAGYRTGLFTSPHIMKFSERIQVNGVCAPDAEIAAVTEEVARVVETLSEEINWFELVTAIAFVYFAKEHCDIVVTEVGLGGEFDATNVIDTPECAVIMNIGLDHTAALGNTPEEIAHAKAGIIKAGGDVVIYRQSESVEAVFGKACAAAPARLHRADFASIRERESSVDGQVFDAAGYEALRLPLVGTYQQKNAAVVLAVMDVLRQKGYTVSEKDIRDGLARVQWPVRFEVVEHDPLFIIDGGHNPQCLEATTESLCQLLPGKRVVFLTGVLADKDVKQMTELLSSVGSEYVTVTPDSPRAMTGDELAERLRALGNVAVSCAGIPEGIEKAREMAGKDGVVCCIGSLYLAGEAKKYFA